MLTLAAATASLALASQATLLAHRGAAQGYSRAGLGPQTCTADRMIRNPHPYLENTLESMRAAFAIGADVVELDVHPTTDGEFAVFHDWTIDCRTEGRGVTREHPMSYLKTLDVGYGYTDDGGKTYPFRGHHRGGMPTLAEALRAFPGKRFLVHVKGNTAAEGTALVDYHAARPELDATRLMFYGGWRPIEIVRERMPQARTMSFQSLKACAWRYVLVGWTGHVPEACSRHVVLVPLNYRWMMWGWPERFVARMREAGSDVYVIGPMHRDEGAGSVGVDAVDTVATIEPGYAGGIWTDRIDVLGPALKGRGP